jgi:hypothetical protein
VSVTARRTADGLWFHGQPLQVGTDVLLDFPRVDVDGRVTGFRTTEST